MIVNYMISISKKSLIKILILSVFILCITSLKAQSLNEIDKAITIKIDSIITLLTVEEKIAMCHAQSKFSSTGVPRLGVPELWMSDGPHGIRAEMNWDNWNYANWTNDYITAFPALTCLAATFNPALSKDYGVSSQYYFSVVWIPVRSKIFCSLHSGTRPLEPCIPQEPLSFIADTDSQQFVIDSGSNRIIVNDASF